MLQQGLGIGGPPEFWWAKICLTLIISKSWQSLLPRGCPPQSLNRKTWRNQSRGALGNSQKAQALASQPKTYACKWVSWKLFRFWQQPSPPSSPQKTYTIQTRIKFQKTKPMRLSFKASLSQKLKDVFPLRFLAVHQGHHPAWGKIQFKEILQNVFSSVADGLPLRIGQACVRVCRFFHNKTTSENSGINIIWHHLHQAKPLRDVLTKKIGQLLQFFSDVKIQDLKVSLGLTIPYMSQLLLLGKVEYGGGPIFKVVLEC